MSFNFHLLKEKIIYSIFNMNISFLQPKNQSAVHLVCSRPTSHALQILRALLAVTPRSIRTNPDVVSDFSVHETWVGLVLRNVAYSIFRLSSSICSINANSMICIEMKQIAFSVYGIYISYGVNINAWKSYLVCIHSFLFKIDIQLQNTYHYAMPSNQDYFVRTFEE